jgi:hypothetical protein
MRHKNKVLPSLYICPYASRALNAAPPHKSPTPPYPAMAMRRRGCGPRRERGGGRVGCAAATPANAGILHRRYVALSPAYVLAATLAGHAQVADAALMHMRLRLFPCVAPPSRASARLSPL